MLSSPLQLYTADPSPPRDIYQTWNIIRGDPRIRRASTDVLPFGGIRVWDAAYAIPQIGWMRPPYHTHFPRIGWMQPLCHMCSHVVYTWVGL